MLQAIKYFTWKKIYNKINKSIFLLSIINRILCCFFNKMFIHLVKILKST